MSDKKNVYINPNFISKSKQIYVNPGFVAEKTKKNKNSEDGAIRESIRMSEEHKVQDIRMSEEHKIQDLRIPDYTKKVNLPNPNMTNFQIQVNNNKSNQRMTDFEENAVSMIQHLQKLPQVKTSLNTENKVQILDNKAEIHSNIKYEVNNKYRVVKKHKNTDLKMNKTAKIASNKHFSLNNVTNINTVYNSNMKIINKKDKDHFKSRLNVKTTPVCVNYGIGFSNKNKSFSKFSGEKSTKRLVQTNLKIINKQKSEKANYHADKEKSISKPFKSKVSQKLSFKTNYFKLRNSGGYLSHSFRKPLNKSIYKNCKFRASAASISRYRLFKSKYGKYKSSKIISKFTPANRFIHSNKKLIHDKVYFRRKIFKTFKNYDLIHLNKRNKNGKLAKKTSDKFVNISGHLYKSTATSLKKQDLTASKKKLKKLSALNKKSTENAKVATSKFVSKKNLISGTLIEIVRRKRLSHFKHVNEYCFFFNKYGKCKKRNSGCAFLHDPCRVAICTRFLQGSCEVLNCPFLHTFDKERMPVCTHFLKGSCLKDNCPYRHVKVNPKAPICKNFLSGHCPHGENCKKKHVLVCEEFKEKGTCKRMQTCPLSHNLPKLNKPKKRKLCKKRRSRVISKDGILGVNSAKVDDKFAIPALRYFACENKEQRVQKTFKNSAKTTDQESFEKSTKTTDQRCFEEFTKTTDQSIISFIPTDCNDKNTDRNDKNNFISNINVNEMRKRLLEKVEKLKEHYTVEHSHLKQAENEINVRDKKLKKNTKIDKNQCAENKKIGNGGCKILEERRNVKIEENFVKLDDSEVSKNESILILPKFELPVVFPTFIPLE